MATDAQEGAHRVSSPVDAVEGPEGLQQGETDGVGAHRAKQGVQGLLPARSAAMLLQHKLPCAHERVGVYLVAHVHAEVAVPLVADQADHHVVVPVLQVAVARDSDDLVLRTRVGRRGGREGAPESVVNYAVLGAHRGENRPPRRQPLQRKRQW